jgi:hypothetical protein
MGLFGTDVARGTLILGPGIVLVGFGQYLFYK